MYKILGGNFKIHMDHSILARRPDLVLINKKKTCQLLDFAFPADHSESEKIDKFLDLAQKLKRTVEQL